MRPSETAITTTNPPPLSTFVPPPQLNRDDFVPSIVELAKANKETVLSLRERTQAAFSRSPSKITRNVTLYRTEVTILANYSQVLLECACHYQLNRTFDGNKRSEFSLMILQHAMKLIATKGTDQPIHIASIGSGALLNEIFLLALLIKNGISNIQLDIVDLFYQDPRTEQEKVNSFHTTEKLKQLLIEFFVLVHFGLGLKIVRGQEVEKTTCITMYKKLSEFSEEKSVLTENPHLQAGQLRLGIFGSADSYADHLAEKQHSPEIIYDVDIEPASMRTEITAPVKSLAQNSARWFALVRTYGNDMSADAVITCEEKNELGWISQSI